MGNPKERESALLERQLLKEGIPVTRKRRYEEELSDSFGKITFQHRSLKKARRSPVPASFSKNQPSAASSSAIAESGNTTADTVPAHHKVYAKEEKMPTMINFTRIQKAYASLGEEFSDPYKMPHGPSGTGGYDRRRQKDRLALKEANESKVEHHYEVLYAHHRRTQEGPIPDWMVKDRVRNHLKIAHVCKTALFFPANLSENEIKIWKTEQEQWVYDKDKKDPSDLTQLNDQPVKMERPHEALFGIEEDYMMKFTVATNTSGLVGDSDSEQAEVSTWDPQTENCHWDGESLRPEIAAGVEPWFEMDNSKFPEITDPAMKHNATVAASTLNAIYRDVGINDFAAKSSPYGPVVVDLDDVKDGQMRLGFFPPPDSKVFDGPLPARGCLPIHDRYAYHLMWLQANGYTHTQLVWMMGQDGGYLRRKFKLSRAEHESLTNRIQSNLMRITRLITRYHLPENLNGRTKPLVRGKGKVTPAEKAAIKNGLISPRRSKGKKISENEARANEARKEAKKKAVKESREIAKKAGLKSKRKTVRFAECVAGPSTEAGDAGSGGEQTAYDGYAEYEE